MKIITVSLGLVFSLLVSGCSHIHTNLEPEEDKVSIPMESGSYGYVIADAGRIADYGWVENDKNKSLIEYDAVKRGNIFYVLVYDKKQVSKEEFASAVARERWRCSVSDKCEKGNNNNVQQASVDGGGGQDNAYWEMVLKDTYKHIGLGCDSNCIRKNSIPTSVINGKQVRGDPPAGTDGVRGLTATRSVASYQVKRKWTSGSIQAGAVATFGSEAAVYDAAYFAVYPLDFFGTKEEYSGLLPLSLNIGFAKNALWDTYDEDVDGLDDSKFIVGIGYTFGAAQELYSLQAGYMSGELDNERLSEAYLGVSLDILKLLDVINKK